MSAPSATPDNQTPSRPSRLKPFFARLRGWASSLRLGPDAQRGAWLALMVTTVLVGGILGFYAGSGLGQFADVILGVLIGFSVFNLLSLLVVLALRLLRALPLRFTAAALAGLLILLYFWDIDYQVIWPLALGILLLEMMFGAVLSVLLRGALRSAAPRRRTALIAILLLTLAGNIALVSWIMYPGPDASLLDVEPYRGEPRISAPNPAEPGTYAVEIVFYGSGTDIRRLEFGPGVALITEPVNAAPFVRIDGWDARLREWYWSFGTDAFPLNGRVWVPQGEGPFPLVLIVHGNHDMNDYSDTGYAYLGELLASRGYIFVSVDENFLNSSLLEGLNDENDARAWILLKHLQAWREWNAAPGNPFYGVVDMSRIALIGHSRGGEAAAIAAAFNRLPYHPDNANLSWDFNFGIRSVIAIAPSDQQYSPADQPTPLTDINYLVIQGAHDADLSTYSGLRQYQRVAFTDPQADWFKAGVYIHAANHSQFNTSWGERDMSGPRGWLLNTAPLLDPESQRQIARLYISAFLDATLRGEDAYRPIFEDYRNAGDWLPPTLYMNQYQDASFRLIAGFQEDIDLTTGTLPGVRLAGNELSSWREEGMEFRTDRAQENQAVFLRWNSNDACYTVSLPNTLAADWSLGDRHILQFSLANADDEDFNTLLDFTILLTDSNGESVAMRLTRFAPLLPQFPAQFTRWPWWEELRYEQPSEPILQTFRLPLSAFAAANPDLNLSQLVEIKFLFNLSKNGEIYLDHVGIAE